MTIADAREKCKSLLARAPRDVLILSVLALASSLSFYLGYLAGLDAGKTSEMSLETPFPAADEAAGPIVASKSGTKYYLPGCAGAERISEVNKIWFVSATAASAAGYAPAVNCKGLSSDSMK